VSLGTNNKLISEPLDCNLDKIRLAYGTVFIAYSDWNKGKKYYLLFKHYLYE